MGTHMTWLDIFLLLIGVATVTWQLFRLIDLIERPSRRSHRRHAVR